MTQENKITIVLIALAIILAGLLSAQSANATGVLVSVPHRCVNRLAPTLCGIHFYHHRVNLYRGKMGLKLRPYFWVAERYPGRRVRILNATKAKAIYWHHAYSLWHRYVQPAANVTAWIPTAKCESTERWHLNGYFDGGLQFLPSTWNDNKPAGYPAYAYEATPSQQVTVANRVLAGATKDPWPNCPTPGSKFA